MSESKLDRPALLVSYVYLANFLKYQKEYDYRDWALDSGAFSAHYSGKAIDLQAYIEKCLELMATDPTLTEIFALDVIGDHIATLRNCERMWKAGVPAIPCFHFGSPESALISMAKDYPKIALGGIAKTKGHVKGVWAGECFKRVWPKKIHGFGYGSEAHIMALPFHSTDASNWELGPCGFGRWMSFGAMSVRGGNQNLRAEVEWYLALERKAQARWKKQMEKLEATPQKSPSIRLVSGWGGDRAVLAKTLGKTPTIRLVGSAEGGTQKKMREALGPPTVRLAIAIQRQSNVDRFKKNIGKPEE